MDPRTATLITRLLYVLGALVVAVWLIRRAGPVPAVERAPTPSPAAVAAP